MAPSRQGLYNPAFEHDACGVAMVADMHGRRSRDIVDKAITALLNLEHRGAQGAEPHTGDGAGILLQVPDEFLRAVVDFELPEPGSYATGIAFLPQSSKDAATACESVREDRRGRGPARAGLARRAHRRLVAGRPGPRCDADVPAGLHRRRIGHGPGTPRLRRAQARRTRTRHQGARPGRSRPRDGLFPKPFRVRHSSTRACSPRRSSRRSTSTCRTSGSPARWASCTPGSRPTRSRRGRWRTRSGASPTTARSTPSRATRTGCARAKR